MQNTKRTQTGIICITGLPGSGKSTVADILTKTLKIRGINTLHYTSDWVRYKLYPKLLTDKNHYYRDFTQDELERSYNGLFMLIDELLKINPDLTIITDGTYRLESHRTRLKEISSRHKREYKIIKVAADEKKLIPRLEKRLKSKKGFGIMNYFEAKKVYEEPKEDIFYIDNNNNLKDLTSQIDEFVNIFL